MSLSQSIHAQCYPGGPGKYGWVVMTTHKHKDQLLAAAHVCLKCLRGDEVEKCQQYLNIWQFIFANVCVWSFVASALGLFTVIGIFLLLISCLVCLKLKLISYCLFYTAFSTQIHILVDLHIKLYKMCYADKMRCFFWVSVWSENISSFF